MNVLSLFSGIGGLELGLERAGMTVVGQVEIDPFCQQVLAKHWPEVPRHDDVRTAPAWWASEPLRPAVDMLAGGFPCQGHSVAGRRLGTTDERWGWPWYRDVIDAVQPRLVLIENSPNLLRTGLVDVLRDLADRGFDAWWNRVPAAALGAPHLRWRLILIAAHSDRIQLRHEPGWPGWASGEGSPVTGHDGATWTLADPVRSGRGWWSGDVAEARGWTEPADRGPLVGDANSAGLEPGRRLGRSGPAVVGTSRWAAEPSVARVAHGVPAGVDRRRALGNAVVPQVGEYVGRLVMAAAGSVEGGGSTPTPPGGAG